MKGGIIEEKQAKIRFYYKRIDELNEEIRIINNLTCEQTNKQTGNNKVLPKGWK